MSSGQNPRRHSSYDESKAYWVERGAQRRATRKSWTVRQYLDHYVGSPLLVVVGFTLSCILVLALGGILGWFGHL